MKIGLKLWSSNTDMISKAVELISSGIFHYIELMPVPRTEPSLFQEYDVPYILHVTSEKFNFNIADDKLFDYNMRIIKENIEWTNNLDAKYMILHPGFGDLNEALAFLSRIDDERIIIENFPRIGINNEEDLLGYSVNQVELLMGEKFGFCLDFGHAVKAAISLKKNYKDFILDLVKLEPNMFHLSDGDLVTEKDQHLNLEEGNYDLNFLMNCVISGKHGHSKHVTLETPRMNLNSFDEDLDNVNRLKKYLS
jgi:deoxyribonuclease-4